MAKEKFVDRGGKEIKKGLEDYYEVGLTGYDEETNTFTILVERRQYSVIGYAMCIVYILAVLLVLIGLWYLISLI